MTNRMLLLLFASWLAQTAQAQKGEKAITAGPLVSIPLGLETRTSNIKTGFGVEVMGQYNFTYGSAILLKVSAVSWAYKARISPYDPQRVIYLTFQGGYRYQFGRSGFFIDGLVGFDSDFSERYTSGSFTLGTGKRFILNDKRFFDVGIDFVGGDGEERINVKVLFSLFR